ncbi:MAG: 16S rRNA (cytosine(967)-C(5))-methyltransferase RsmB [Eubacterium sp.]|nr:16S rRNA (cytosine(967)-C(5))-methyltransferase RsmB [Eubacterium sp.]
MRRAVFDIVYGTLEQNGHSDEWFHRVAEQDSARGRNWQEKGFIRRASYGTIEQAAASDRVIDLFSKTPAARLKPAIRTILRMGIYELWYMNSVPAAATCNEMVKLAKKKNFQGLAGYVNGLLRNVARADKEELCGKVLGKCQGETEKLAFIYSVPEGLVQLLTEAYGKKTTEKILASFESENPLTIRVQTMNASASQVLDNLTKAGIQAVPCPYVSHAFRLSGVERVEELPGFAEGHFIIQDESSMLPVMVSGIRPGDSVVDVCSSPGGKALYAADLLEGTGMVSARDVSEYKLHRIRENVQRLKAENIEIKLWDGRAADPEWEERADVVIADVPCSGIGVIGRKPEIRYTAVQNAPELQRLQRNILRGSVRALRPGGTLIYSTCTVNPAENEENARWIAEEFSLRPVPLDRDLPEELKNKMTRQGMLQILPGIHEGNGFFVAKFIKLRRPM